VLRLPESPRKRARLIRGVSIGVVLLAIAAVSVRYRNAGHSYATPIDPSKPAVVIREPPHVPATRAMRRAAEATLATFARTALIRRDGETSWRLATPHMTRGDVPPRVADGGAAGRPVSGEGLPHRVPRC